MKCIICGKDAEYVFDGSSFCLEHFKEMKEKKPSDDSLRIEYKILNEYTFRREDSNLVVNSIIVSATVLMVTFAVENRESLGMSTLLGIPISGFIPLVGILLLLIPFFLLLSSRLVDDACFKRIGEIEDTLHMKGTRYVLKQVENKRLFKLRRILWYILFGLLIAVYAFTSYWLFTHPLLK